MSANRKGYRGYINARMGMGRSAPQNIQQLVMRDYCAKRNMEYLLAATEYCMPGCTMILDAVMGEFDHLEGMVMYSIALLPESKEKRMELYRTIIGKGCTLHMAVEGAVVKDWDDAMRLEDVFVVKEVMDKQNDASLRWLQQYDKGSPHAGA